MGTLGRQMLHFPTLLKYTLIIIFLLNELKHDVKFLLNNETIDITHNLSLI